MSRTIVAAAVGLGLALAFAVGCGSKEPPSQPSVSLTNEPKPDPNGNSPPTVTFKPSYELDPAKHVIPTGMVSGVLGGEPVLAEVRLEGSQLVLQSREAMPGEPPGASSLPWRMEIDLPPEAFTGGSYRVQVKPEDISGLEILVQFPKLLMIKQWSFFQFARFEPLLILKWLNGYAMTLELGKRDKGLLPGKIYLSLPEMDAQSESQRRSFLAGSFEALCARTPTEPPREDDIPFVNGSVTVIGAPADALLRVGYGAAPTPTMFPLGSIDIQLGDPITPPRWAQATHDKPRVSNVIAGNGKDVPSRFEHSKLMPNRYLVFAELKDGPAAWKWVNVFRNTTMKLDLTIDATKTGGLEAVVPFGVLGTVQLVPADDPGQGPIPPSLFAGMALNMRLEEEITNRKALFTKLAEGRYEARAGGLSRFVDIVAGKVTELDFDKLPPLPKIPVQLAPEPKEKP